MKKYINTIEDPEMNHKAVLLKVIAHDDRLKMIGMLVEGERLTVSQISQSTGISMSEVSMHLIKLKNKGILHSSRDGRMKRYFIATKEMTAFLKVITEATDLGTAQAKTYRWKFYSKPNEKM